MIDTISPASALPNAAMATPTKRSYGGLPAQGGCSVNQALVDVQQNEER